MTESIRPFRLDIPQPAIDDLHARLDRVRWPDEAPPEQGAPWAYGTSLAFMIELVHDWRRTEAELNAWPQFKTRIDGIDLHFLHVPGKGPHAAERPLLLSHGWPGSVLEFTKLIPRLTDPVTFGGDARDAFTVVLPSLPGYTLSFTEHQPRKGVAEIGVIFDTLMRERLGYARYGAQGGDWGSFITAWLGAYRRESLHGIHLNMMPLKRDAAAFANPSAIEQRYVDALQHFMQEEAGYQAIQGTRPQTLAFALADSPLGLAAWFSEKYRAWTDNQGDPREALTMDEMLGNLSLYWFSNCIGASFWPYYARLHGPWPIAQNIDVPTAYCQFPREILQPPREAAERQFTNIHRWTNMPRGGHFAAWEQPDALAAEVRAFFRDCIERTSTMLDTVKPKSIYQPLQQGLKFPEVPAFDNKADERRHLKQRLVAACRAFAVHGLDYGFAGHLTIRDPEHHELYWTNPMAVHFAQVKMSNLILADHKGRVVQGEYALNRAGFVLHAAVHEAHPDILAMCHAHTVYGVAYAAFGRPLPPVTQDACAFFEDHIVVSDEGGKVAVEEDAGHNFASAFKGVKAAIHQNHGLITASRHSIEAAAFWFIALERCCQQQLMIDATGIAPTLVPPDKARYSREHVGSEYIGWLHFQPIYERLVLTQADMFE